MICSAPKTSSNREDIIFSRVPTPLFCSTLVLPVAVPQYSFRGAGELYESRRGGLARFVSDVRSATASEKQCSSRCGSRFDNDFSLPLLLRGLRSSGRGRSIVACWQGVSASVLSFSIGILFLWFIRGFGGDHRLEQNRCLPESSS